MWIFLNFRQYVMKLPGEQEFGNIESPMYSRLQHFFATIYSRSVLSLLKFVSQFHFSNVPFSFLSQCVCVCELALHVEKLVF
jgi:hypothetical protein